MRDGLRANKTKVAGEEVRPPALAELCKGEAGCSRKYPSGVLGSASPPRSVRNISSPIGRSRLEPPSHTAHLAQIWLTTDLQLARYFDACPSRSSSIDQIRHCRREFHLKIFSDFAAGEPCCQDRSSLSLLRLRSLRFNSSLPIKVEGSNSNMCGHHQQKWRLFDEICALLLACLRYPHLLLSSSQSPSPPRLWAGAAASGPKRRSQISPAGFALLLLGASFALVLCGSVTFVLGCILLPWVIGIVMVMHFVGIISSLSDIAKASLSFAVPEPSPPSPKEVS